MFIKDFGFRAVQRLYSIRDSKRIVSARGGEVTLNQLPFFFLTSMKGMQRLEIVPNGGIVSGFYKNRSRRRILKGTKSPQEMRILYNLPQGKEIGIRPFGARNPFLLRDNREYEFELGKKWVNEKYYGLLSLEF